MRRYSIGIDFGTLSARAIVADVATGRTLGSAAMDYPHGVMTDALPNGTPLKPDWAVQDPRDYLECLRAVVPAALREAAVAPGDVVGLGIDVTACTVLPVDADNRPLCLREEFAAVPHAWMLLWKHHAAQDYANRMTEIARARGERFLASYGDRVSSEWLFPKLWQVLDEAPGVYAAADRFIDAADWLVQRLTGSSARAAGLAGYKGFWRNGYPDPAFFAACDPRFERVAVDKLRGDYLPIGARAGTLTAEGAALVGLDPGTPVAVGNIDAHASVPGAGLTEPGSLLMILGTSACHMLIDEGPRDVPGICGAVPDGMMPGLTGYEAGQSCMGDHFAWFVKQACPEYAAREAREAGMDLHAWLSAKAARLRPGESGLLALDWWNGNRSVLADFDLSGLILGMTLSTRPEAVYRALIEATAYGARTIVENFEAHGLRVRRLYACGGIARKNPLLMQLWADVLNREIAVVGSDQTSALGAAITGAVAAGRAAGGWDSLPEAVRAMAAAPERRYAPSAGAAGVYDQLYREYLRLHDLFGRGGNDVMKRLRAVSRGSRE